jgi:lipopolysaccharide heptosyltransferase II
MNVLQILPELNVGGVETGTVDFAKYLLEHGHHSFVISNGGKLVSDLEKNGSKHFKLPVHKKSLFSIIRLVKIVRKIIQNEKIDVVHARSRVPAWIAFFACRGTNASFITTCHGYYQNRWFSQVMGWGKLVIVPSQAIGRHMVDDFHVHSENIRCIPRSVDLDKFKSLQREKSTGARCNIAIIGRITPLKGHTYFLKAMAKVLRSVPYAKVWIVGDAPAKKENYKEELEVLVRRLGIQERVDFLGSRSDVPQILMKTDIVVLSTVTQEAFGRVILEAQAAGVAVVATKVGGVVDIIDDGETGLLVMPRDIDAMAKEVVRLAQDKVLYQQLVANAQKKIQEKFTLEHMASTTLKVYDELLKSINILVMKISSIGDVVLVVPALKAIREKFPFAKIFCLVGKDSRKIIRQCPYIDGMVVYDYKGKDKGWLKFLKLAAQLRQQRIDKIIDFQNSKKSHLLSFLSLPGESYGYDNGKYGFLLSRTIKNDQTQIGPVTHQFRVLSMLGIKEPANARLELWITDKDRKYVDELLESEWLGNAKRIVGINIAASERWMTKNWPVEYVAKLCEMLTARNIRVIITGLEKDRILVNRLAALTHSKPAVIIGRTDIPQLAELIRRCNVYISPDSAPLHLAAAVQTPFIALFGPTSSARHLPPVGNVKCSVIEKKLACAPCYSQRCKILTHACMRDITPESILKEIERIIGVMA